MTGTRRYSLTQHHKKKYIGLYSATQKFCGSMHLDDVSHVFMVKLKKYLSLNPVVRLKICFYCYLSRDEIFETIICYLVSTKTIVDTTRLLSLTHGIKINWLSDFFYTSFCTNVRLMALFVWIDINS